VGVGGTSVAVAVGSNGVLVCVAVGGTGVGVLVGVGGAGVAVFVGVAVAVPTAIVTDLVAWPPRGSVARSVTTWVPTTRLFRVNDVPTPRPGCRLEFQIIWTPPSGPVSGSMAVPVNWIVAPGAYNAPCTGEMMVTTGG
jgi:hypothetical protein